VGDGVELRFESIIQWNVVLERSTEESGEVNSSKAYDNKMMRLPVVFSTDVALVSSIK
jgi:hypothetical protein